MRILLVSLHHVEYAVELARALGEKYRVHLVLLKEKVSNTIGAQIDQKIGGNVTCTQLPYTSMKHPSIINVLFSIFYLYFKFRPDVIHLQESVNPLNFFFLLFRSKPLVVTVHDVTLHPGTPTLKRKRKSWKIKLFHRSRQRSHKLIVHGEILKQQLLRKFNKSSGDVFVVPHGALFSYLPDNGAKIDEEPHTVLFFGRIQKYKGLKYLIEAEPLVSKVLPEFKIIVAGHGEDIETYRSLLSSNSHFEVHDHFILNRDVYKFFLRASAVVLPYIEGSQSGIAAMAFAFGKPVIATNVGSIPEMVEHNKTGIIVPARNKEILSRAIIDLLQNTDKRKSFSQNARKAALTKFGWNHIAELTTKSYEQAIESMQING
jgi:glycosyltransferase involved in cell wall biosynthesis